MSWLKSQIVKLVLRHAVSALGAALATKGILSSDDADKAWGAIAVLAAIGHSIWDKRQLIIDELKKVSNTTPLLLALLLPALCLTGCKSYQAVHASSGTGVNMTASIPIPGTGGSTLIGLKLIAGLWKDAAILQPTTTNTVTAPNVVINMDSSGAANASGQGGVGTNGVAGLGANNGEGFTVITGEGSKTNTNSTSLKSGK